MEFCTVFNILCATVLLTILYTQGQTTNSITVSVEAMCSADSAGLRWNATYAYDTYTVEVSFNCTTPDNVEISTDVCFEKPQTSFNVRSMPDPSNTHIIGTKLDPGTVCTFKADAYDDPFFSFPPLLLNTVSASCTVGSSAARLPVQCEVNNTQECQCSCSPGFIERPGQSLECDRIDMPPTTTTMETPKTHAATSTHIPTTIATLWEETLQSTPRLLSTTPVQSETSMPQALSTTPVQPVTSMPQALSTTLVQPVVIPTPTLSTHHSPVLENKMLSTLLLFLLPVIIITVLLVNIGVAGYRKNRLKRIHEQMAMPFESLKYEKIDPDFNPVTIEPTICRSASIHSVFHVLELNPVIQETYGHKEESYDLTKMKGLTVGHSEYDNSNCSESSGYVTEREVIELVDNYLVSSHNDPSSQERTDSITIEESPTDYVLPITNVSFNFPV